MAVTQTTLRSTLALILSVDAAYIVPKQGNWFNPQDAVKTSKPDTWIAYYIHVAKPRAIPFLMASEAIEDTNVSIVPVRCKLYLQFVGYRAEELAQSIQHWPRRSDVHEYLADIGATLMMSDLGYEVSTYYQDGLSSTLSFNVAIDLMFENTLDTTQEIWLAPGSTGLFIS
jgi:hypothetical protein